MDMAVPNEDRPMASADKQKKRAQRAKTKAKQNRMVRSGQAVKASAGDSASVEQVYNKAMESGSILLLDEVDLGSHKIMCLQPVLEGKGVFLKKINRWVTPKPGFNVLATANTKGKGSDDGRFAGTNILNEAFLDRFDFTYEQDYASNAVEKKILTKYADSLGVKDEAFIDNLIAWGDIIRKSFKQQVVSEIITTRRLLHIIKAFSIFGDKMKSVERCVARFDDTTKEAFVQMYTKVDADAQPKPQPTEAATVQSNDPNACPF